VQNDEYSEYRRALADGKIIQFYYEIHNVEPKIEGEWRDWNSYGQCFDSTIKYRIKPEGPEFKVGDWVREKSSGFIIQAYENMISKNFELWKPKVGEWCVFWDHEKELSSGSLIVDLFKEELSIGYVSENILGAFKYIAPLEFIETIKG